MRVRVNPNAKNETHFWFMTITNATKKTVKMVTHCTAEKHVSTFKIPYFFLILSFPHYRWNNKVSSVLCAQKCEYVWAMCSMLHFCFSLFWISSCYLSFLQDIHSFYFSSLSLMSKCSPTTNLALRVCVSLPFLGLTFDRGIRRRELVSSNKQRWDDKNVSQDLKVAVEAVVACKYEMNRFKTVGAHEKWWRNFWEGSTQRKIPQNSHEYTRTTHLNRMREPNWHDSSEIRKHEKKARIFQLQSRLREIFAAIEVHHCIKNSKIFWACFFHPLFRPHDSLFLWSERKQQSLLFVFLLHVSKCNPHYFYSTYSDMSLSLLLPLYKRALTPYTHIFMAIACKSVSPPPPPPSSSSRRTKRVINEKFAHWKIELVKCVASELSHSHSHSLWPHFAYFVRTLLNMFLIQMFVD